MRKLSAYTAFYKWVLPLMFCGFLVFVVCQGTAQEAAQGRSAVPFVLVPLIFAIVAGFFWFRTTLDLTDVWLKDDLLILQRHGRHATTPLSNIVNVNDLTACNWPRVILLLREPCEFGKEVAFSPAGGRSSFFKGRNAVIADLITRIDQARLQHQAS